jgi:hypothetical protein
MIWKSFDTHREPAMSDFARVPDALYAADPWHVPTAVDQLVRKFDPRWNPFFEYGCSRQFVAYQGGIPAARCAAAVNPRMDHDGQRVGVIGFFESVDDPDLAASLLERATDWLRDQQVTLIYGPMNFSIWGGYRFKTGGFDLEPIIGEPYHKPYYAGLIQAAGFEPCGLWYSNEVDLRTDAGTVLRKQAKLATRLATAERAGYRIVALSSPRPNEHIMRELHDIVMESYAGFFGFYPISREEFSAIYGDLRRILRRNQLLLAYRNNQLCGVMIQYWDWAPLLRACRGKPGLLTALRLRFGPVPGRWILAVIGIRAAAMAERSGLGSALVHEGVREALAQHASRLTYSLMGEHNRSMSLACDNPALRRTYTLYRIRT